jgi:hypothetical protein
LRNRQGGPGSNAGVFVMLWVVFEWVLSAVMIAVGALVVTCCIFGIVALNKLGKDEFGK